MTNIQGPESVVIQNPQDPHVHLRGYNGLMTSPEALETNKIMQLVTPMNVMYSRILAMPNTIPRHLETVEDINWYMELVEAWMPVNKYYTETIFTISLTDNITPETIESVAWMIWGVKYYPGGVTTNSGESKWDLDINDSRVHAVLEKMQKLWIVLNLHPETTHQEDEHGHTTKGFVHDAEREFKSIIEQIAEEFPSLKIVVEHVSTKENAELIASWKYPNVFATITPQHLMLTAHDKEGGHGFETAVHCKPTMKWPEDLIAIQDLVLSGNINVSYWSDSAPHPIDKKESLCCAAWVFSSPVWIQILTDWFFKPETISYALSKWYIQEGTAIEDLTRILQNFLWNNANNVYGEPEFSKTITLERKKMEIPNSYWTDPKVVPIFHWQDINYSIVEATVYVNGEVKNLLK